MDQIVERLYTDNPNETYGKVPKRMDEQGLYKRVYQYYEEIDDPETETKIKKLLENPNPEEIKRVLRTRTGRSIAEELNLNISTTHTTLGHIKSGKGSGYIAARLAHYLINHGYCFE